MILKWAFIFILLPIIFLESCKTKEEKKAPSQVKLSATQFAAKFPYDLGPSTIDISSYPKEIQESYKLFLGACSICHTPARPLNSPYIKAADWKRFVQRMHLKMMDRAIPLDKSVEKKIIEFLVYDSKVRKMDRRAEFNAQQENLNQLYSDLVKERDKLIIEETENLPKKETPYVGVK